MAYLFFKILLCLGAAALLGGLIGWLLRGLGFNTRLDNVERTWRRQLEVAESEKNRLANDFAAQSRSLKKITSDHAACAPHIQELSETLDAAQAVHSGCADKINGLKQKLAESENAVESMEQQLDELRSDLKERIAVGSNLEQDAEATKARVVRFKSDFEEARHEKQRLETELASAKQALAEHNKENARLRQRLAELEPEIKLKAVEPVAETDAGAGKQSDDERPGWLLDAPDGPKDDLKKIRGIGPVLERTLNELGVFHFRQIAEFTEADIHWVTEHIQTFPDRIARDDWVGQAAKLAKKKSK